MACRYLVLLLLLLLPMIFNYDVLQWKSGCDNGINLPAFYGTSLTSAFLFVPTEGRRFAGAALRGVVVLQSRLAKSPLCFKLWILPVAALQT